MKSALTIAIPKGYLLEESLTLFQKIGITFPKNLHKTRKLYTWDDLKSSKILQVRPWDVPIYVEQGAADLGIVGLDVLNEKNEKIIKLLDLKFGYCRLVLAGQKPTEEFKLSHYLTVATKYPNCTKEYFQKRGYHVRILKMYGAIELGPFTGLSDLICDLTASGKTLEENHLHILDTVFESSAYLIANPVSMRFKNQRIVDLTSKMKLICQ